MGGPAATLNDALAGLTVLDLSQGIAGPYCALLLGDLGARVLKVEPPEGDWVRSVGERQGDSNVTYKCFNRGKQGVMLDLKEPRAREAALKLADSADVLVESSRPGVAERLGMGYAALAARNPRLVCVSVTGFGQHGPYAQRPATDAILQALTGVSLGVGGAGTPVRVKLALIDVSTGIYASHATLAALIRRATTGRGQHLDISLMHSAAALQGYKIAEAVVARGRPAQAELFAGVGIYRTQDGYLTVTAMRDRQVLGLLEVAGCADLAADARYATPEARLANQDGLRAEIAQRLAARPTRHWVDVMRAADLMCQEVLDYEGFLRDAHAGAVHLFDAVEFAGAGALPMVRAPGTDPGAVGPMASPLLGEHTLEVLLRAGVAAQDAEALAQSAERARSR